jgi:hypothetical protein
VCACVGGWQITSCMYTDDPKQKSSIAKLSPPGIACRAENVSRALILDCKQRTGPKSERVATGRARYMERLSIVFLRARPKSKRTESRPGRSGPGQYLMNPLTNDELL